MTNEEIREWQEAARREKVKADEQKKQKEDLTVSTWPGKTEPKEIPIDKVIETARPVIDKKKEAQKRWREKNRERLAEEEKARRAKK